MASDAQERQPEGESIDECERKLDGYDCVDETSQDLARKDCVLFDGFREVVETTGWCRNPLSNKALAMRANMDGAYQLQE